MILCQMGLGLRIRNSEELRSRALAEEFCSGDVIQIEEL
jgi:hypothetical protein